jgi:PKD repeat protein
MTSSDVVTGRACAARFGRLVRAPVVLLVATAIVCLGLAGMTLSASASGAGSRPVVAATGLRPDTSGQECFFTFPDCTSADPMVAFTMVSSGDSTGCTFKQDTSWGDGTADTIKTYKGGPKGAALATFTHTYAEPGTYSISYTITVTKNNGSCQGGTGGLQFTLPAPPPANCQAAPVTVPATSVSVPIDGTQVTVGYESAQQSFATTTASSGALCTVRSGPVAQPLDLTIPGAMISLGQSDTTATTVDIFAANQVATTIPACDFAALQAQTSASTTPPLKDFANTDNCLLTPTFHASWDFIARWTAPGFVQQVPAQGESPSVEMYTTRPATYYVDLDALPNAPSPSGTFQDTMEALATYVYSTLGQNVPAIDRIALIGDPPQHLLVTNPLGRAVGIDSKNRTHGFSGGGYAEVGRRSFAWILEPVVGDYHVSVNGPGGSKFSTEFADLQFLGHGTAPLLESFSWAGSLPRDGYLRKRFSIRGTALAPVLTPHASKARVKVRKQIRFTLTGSVIPLGIAQVVWLFGDGTRAVGRPAAHRYRKAGRYFPTVTVTDAVGDTVTVKMPVIVVKR